MRFGRHWFKNIPKPARLLALGAGFAAAGWLALPGTAAAATKSWSGNAGGCDQNWQTANCWAGSAPSAGDDLVFDGANLNGATNNNFTAGTVFHSIQFTGTATSTLGITGNSLGINGNITLNQTGGFSLQLNVPLAISGGVTIANNDVSSGPNFTSGISGTGGVTVGGTGDVQFDVNTYSGPTTITSGTLFSTGASSIPSGSALTLNAGATLNIVSGNLSPGSLAGAGTITNAACGCTLTVGGDNTSTTFSGTLPNGIPITKTGSGTWTVSGNNAGYGSAITVNNGTIVAGSSNALGTGAIGLAGGTSLSASGTQTIANALTFNGAVNITGSGNLTLNSMAGAGSLVVNCSCTLTLPNANTYSGGTTVTAGTLTAGNSTALGTGSFTLGSGTFASSAGTYAYPITLSGNGTINNTSAGGNLVLNGAIGGSGGLTLTSGSTIGITLGTTNTYTGPTTIAAGTGVVATGSGVIPSSSAVTLNGSMAEQAGAFVTFGSLAGSGTMNDSQGVTIGGDNTSTTFSGKFINGGTITKTGTGTLTLSGTSNTFGGTMALNQGGLSVTGSLPAVITVAAGATLSGSGSIKSATISGTLSPGAGGSPGKLTATNGATFNAGSTFSVVLNGATAGTGYSQLNATGGTVALGGNPTLNVTLGYTPALGDQLAIVSGTTTGTLSGIAEGGSVTASGNTFTTNYHSVVLTASAVAAAPVPAATPVPVATAVPASSGGGGGGGPAVAPAPTCGSNDVTQPPADCTVSFNAAAGLTGSDNGLSWFIPTGAAGQGTATLTIRRPASASQQPTIPGGPGQYSPNGNLFTIGISDQAGNPITTFPVPVTLSMRQLAADLAMSRGDASALTAAYMVDAGTPALANPNLAPAGTWIVFAPSVSKTDSGAGSVTVQTQTLDGGYVALFTNPNGYVQTLNPSAGLYSSFDPATGRTFGNQPQFSFLRVIEPQVGSRLLVQDRSGNYAYVNAADVAPSGAPPA